MNQVPATTASSTSDTKTIDTHMARPTTCPAVGRLHARRSGRTRRGRVEVFMGYSWAALDVFRGPEMPVAFRSEED